MYFTYEEALWIGIVSLYLYDSIKLIDHNKIIIKKGFFKWGYIFPSDFLTLKNKIIFILNTISPHYSCYLFCYPVTKSKSSRSDIKKFNSFENSLFALKVSCLLKFFLILLFFPLSLIMAVGEYVSLTILAAGYSLILLDLIYMLFILKKLNISKVKCFTLFFTNFLCPPFSINLVKDLSLSHCSGYSLLTFANLKFSKSNSKSFIYKLKLRIDKQLEEGIYNKAMKIKMNKFKGSI